MFEGLKIEQQYYGIMYYVMLNLVSVLLTK